MIRNLCGATASVLVLAAVCVAADAPPAADESPRSYAGEPLSLDFQDVEVRAALQLVADFAGLNLVAGEAVAGKVTLRLVDVPWDEALDLILAASDLAKRQTGNVLLVAPAAQIAADVQDELEQRKAMADLAPFQTEFIRIRYADAAELAAFGGAGAPVALSASGSLRVDPRTNSIILTDTRDNIAAFKGVVARLDVPMQQVWIEARLINANSNVSEELGVRWRAIRSRVGSPRTNVELEVAEAPVNAILSSSVGILGAGYDLELALSALAARGNAEIIARPKVVTADQGTATIEAGVEIPYQQATRSGATSIAFKDAVLRLEVTPRITPSGRIAMELNIKQDTVGRIYHGVPSINTTRIATRVRVDNGETVVLGGIFVTDRHRSATRTPLLGDIPVLGALFRRTVARDDKQELLIFITPRVLSETRSESA